jgi:hypothetical protein
MKFKYAVIGGLDYHSFEFVCNISFTVWQLWRNEKGEINDFLLGLDISPSVTTIPVGLLPNSNNG